MWLICNFLYVFDMWYPYTDAKMRIEDECIMIERKTQKKFRDRKFVFRYRRVSWCCLYAVEWLYTILFSHEWLNAII